MVYPNPARRTVYFSYFLQGEASITIDIYQISGAHVARITENKPGGSGNPLITPWQTDGIARGIYLGHVVATDANGRRVLDQKRKIALVK
jgi:hypothetical protein